MNSHPLNEIVGLLNLKVFTSSLLYACDFANIHTHF